MGRREGSIAFVPFEELRVFQMAETFADEVWNIVLGWKNFPRDTVGKQLVRSADSIGANIAEGTGRATKRDNQRFIRISRGSLNESVYWLRRAKTRGLIGADVAAHLNEGTTILGRSLNAYLNSLT